MLIKIEKVLSPFQLSKARAFLEQGEFVDGRLSAGTVARTIKDNEELSRGSQVYDRLNEVVMKSLVRNPVYQAFALPLKYGAPFYARYRAGRRYGYHIDDPIMGEGPRYRTDVSTTVFLNDPSEYEGGELSIRTPFGVQEVKLAAGDAVVYPSTSLHQVNEITAGERLVMVTWVQSMVRDPHRREMLYELHLAREKLLAERPGDEETEHVDHVYVNLVRMWADT